MATTDFWGVTGDGYLFKDYVSHYSEAREAAAAGTAVTGSANAGIGWAPPYNRLYRQYIFIDTTDLTGTAEITAGTLRLDLNYEDSVPGGHEIVLMNGGTFYPGSTLSVSDFNRTKYKSGGAGNITIYSGQAGSYKTFTLNSTGCGWVNPGGTTTFCLMSEFDVSPTNPGYGMYASFHTANEGGNARPRLRLTYGTRPTVQTDGATGISHNAATAAGTLLSTGSDSITEVGAIWNDDGSDPANFGNADNNAQGALVAEAWTVSLSGLEESTKYIYRAYAKSSVGYGYGATGSFTTDAAPATLDARTLGTTGLSTTGATFNGNIAADGGDGITEHGFIWKQNSDPYEEASPINNPTGAANYKLLGTGSEGTFAWHEDGLTSGAVYLYRAFAQTTGGTNYGGLRVLRLPSSAIETTVYGLTGDGLIEIYQDFAPYLCGYYQALSSGYSLSTTGTQLQAYWKTSLVPQRIVTLRRSYLYFDTSSIPENASLSSARLYIYITDFDETAQGGANLYVYDGQATYPHSPLVLSDFGISHYSVIANKAISAAFMTGNAYNNITLPVGSINAGGTTKLMLVPTECAGSDKHAYVYFNSADAAANKPKLVIAYYDRGDSPPLPRVNANGTMKTSDNGLIRVDGQWRLVTAAQIMVGGAWKDCTGG